MTCDRSAQKIVTCDMAFFENLTWGKISDRDMRPPVGGGVGSGLQYEMPRCVSWGSENEPIMKDACV